MKFRDLSIVSKIIFISVIFTWSVISYWLFYPYKPIEINSPIEISNQGKVVYPGSVLYYRLNVKKFLPIPCLVSRQLENDIIITYSPILSDIKVGVTNKEIPLNIPDYAPAGKYKLKWVAVYQVNPIRVVKITAYSEDFWVR